MRPIQLTDGYKPDHAKESEDVWVRRVLGIEQGPEVWLTELSHKSAVVTMAGMRHTITLPRTRLIALRAWVLNVLNERPENGRVGGAIAVMLRSPQLEVELICQQKDDQHPTEACRGRYCLFGGSGHEGETIEETILREFYEEIRDVGLADMLASKMIIKGLHRLPSVQWEGEYQAAFGVALTSDTEEFAHWRERLLSPGVFSESNQAHLKGVDLFRKIVEERRQPGYWFVGSHHTLIADILGF